MTDTALILVDIQNDYFENGNWPVAKIAAASANAARLLEHARKSGQLVVHVHHEIPSDEAPFFRPGTDGARIHASVTPQKDEAVILKHHPNSFRETFAGTAAGQQDSERDDLRSHVANVHRCDNASGGGFRVRRDGGRRCLRRQGSLVRQH